MKPGRIPSKSPRGWRGPRWSAGFTCALALGVLLSGAAVAQDTATQGSAAPLRMVNLNPFHLLYGVPASFGARVMPSGSSELIASMDVASHLSADRSGADQVLMDGETYRQALTLRQGLGDGWEYLLDIPAVSHSGGALDGFIENWHRAFGLPQGQRDRTPRDRLAFLYTDDSGTRIDIDRGVLSLGDASLGVGYAMPSSPFPNDGMVVRAAMKLPSGDEAALAGSGGFSASVWAETSGALPDSSISRRWLYTATLGALAGEAPTGLSDIGGRFIAFGRLGVAGAPTPAPDGAGRCSLVTLQRHRLITAFGRGRHARIRRHLETHGGHAARNRRDRRRRHVACRARYRPARRHALDILGAVPISADFDGKARTPAPSRNVTTAGVCPLAAAQEKGWRNRITAGSKNGLHHP